MKVAVCLSGHLRKFEQTFPSLNDNLLKHYDCDVFVHTWDKLGYACAYKSDSLLGNSNDKLAIANALYKPKKIVIESDVFVEELKSQGDQYAPHLKNVPKHVGHMASMFYKIYAANEIRKLYQLQSGVKYDWVIRCRPDLVFNSKINLPNHDLQKLLIPRGMSNPTWYNDQFCIAKPEEMDLYSSMFFDIPGYFVSGGEFYPEKFVVWALNKKQIPVNFCDVNFYILR